MKKTAREVAKEINAVPAGKKIRLTVTTDDGLTTDVAEAFPQHFVIRDGRPSAALKKYFEVGMNVKIEVI